MKVHFIGIGGIGVSALAQYYLKKGHEVSGSDLVASEITNFLKDMGVKIAIGNYPDYIKNDFELVVYSPAVKKDNPELKRALELGITTKAYPEALGELTKNHFTIAVSGSHGKSTTTAMIALVLVKAKLDPTVIVGTKLKEFASPAEASREGGATNFREGKSNFLVIEACEYDGSFLNYDSKITVVTNIDKEHLDYFKTFANVVKTFKDFIKKLPSDGFLVANRDDKKLVGISQGEFTTKYYSLKNKESAKLKKMLKVPGQHNISNALAVLAVARILDIKDAVTFKALSQFKGTWRRFEVKEGKADSKHITVVSDYGHHPTEILATLKAAREKYSKKNIWCIFQPHQYQRTFYLLKDFIKLFRQVKIDHIIITDIYDVAGREEKSINQQINSEMLVKKINKKTVQYMNIDEAEKYAKEHMSSGEVLVIMGAGDVYKLFDKF